MNIIATAIPDVKIIEPKVFGDSRGYFFESFSQQKFSELVEETVFVQDNESKSSYGVVRGLHYQLPPFTQAKLVRVVSGAVLDIAVDIREGSPTFGQHVAMELSEANKRMAYVPKGFAHGFSVLSEEAVFSYKCDNYYQPSHERGIRFDDPALKIDWQIAPERMVFSQKDKESPLLADAEIFTA